MKSPLTFTTALLCAAGLLACVRDLGVGDDRVADASSTPAPAQPATGGTGGDAVAAPAPDAAAPADVPPAPAETGMWSPDAPAPAVDVADAARAVEPPAADGRPAVDTPAATCPAQLSFEANTGYSGPRTGDRAFCGAYSWGAALAGRTCTHLVAEIPLPPGKPLPVAGSLFTAKLWLPGDAASVVSGALAFKGTKLPPSALVAFGASVAGGVPLVPHRDGWVAIETSLERAADADATALVVDLQLGSPSPCPSQLFIDEVEWSTTPLTRVNGGPCAQLRDRAACAANTGCRWVSDCYNRNFARFFPGCFAVEDVGCTNDASCRAPRECKKRDPDTVCPTPNNVCF